jgi:hypothetical protein
MNAYLSPLEIQIHLRDGNVTRFLQDDPEISRHILAHIHPDRIFTQPEILLAGEHSLTAYPSSAVTRMDLVMAGFPDWTFQGNICDISEITEIEFQERLASQIARKYPHLNQDGSRRVFGEIELVTGQHLFREVHWKPMQDVAKWKVMPQDYNVLLHQQFCAHSHYCRRQGGGAILVNPEHIVRMTFYPGPATPPENAWRMHAVKR